MTCLVLNMSAMAVVKTPSMSNAKSIYTLNALNSGMLYFVDSAEAMDAVPKDDVDALWDATKEHRTRAGVEEGDGTAHRFNAWNDMYATQDIWIGTPIYNAQMKVMHANERAQKNSESGVARAAAKPRMSKDGPWVLNKDAIELFKAESFKQRRVIGARLCATAGEGEAFTRAAAVEVCKQAYEAGEYNVSAKTKLLAEVMFDQIWDWHLSSLIKSGIIKAIVDK